ncbi:MAG: AMP-binding protein [Gemmatimonadota bacterium]|nr:AMP-binding protein [Gemmatimonadota bacterium]
MSDATLPGLFERAAGSAKGVRFLGADDDAPLRGYAELLERARRTGAALAALGVVPGDRVAIVLPTGIGFYDAFFGASSIGAVPAPLYPPVRLGRLREYLDRTAGMLRGCRARIVVTDRRIARVIGRAVAAAGPPLGLVTLERLVADGGEPSGSGRPAVPERSAEPHPDDVALIQHSSGTTGRPRPVRLSHRAVLANVDAIRARLREAHPEPRDEHAAVSWLPLYHDMGLIGCVITAMAHPVDLTLIPPERFIARPAAWLRAVSRYRATVSGAPDFAYSYAAERVTDAELEGVDLSSWLVALNGAEPVTAGAMERFASRFAPFGFRRSALTPVYGLAEATLAVSFSDPSAPYRTIRLDREALVRDGVARPLATGPDPTASTLVSVGTPLPGVTVRVVGPDGADTAEGVVGRVLVGGDSLHEGYDDELDCTGPILEWLDTGDTGFVLDGELFLYGRARDVIVLRGSKYAPQDIEHAVSRLDGVRAGCVAAIGAADAPGHEEQLVLLAERARGRASTGDDALADSLRRAVVSTTGLECGRVVILEPGTLPRTSSGKIRRGETHRRYLAERLDGPGSAGPVTLLGEAVRSTLALARLRRGGTDSS